MPAAILQLNSAPAAGVIVGYKYVVPLGMPLLLFLLILSQNV